MNKHLPKKAKDIKGKVAIAELVRAHWIVALLALSFALLVVYASLYEVQLDRVLSLIVAGLLVLVAAVSLATIYALAKR